MSRLPLGAWDFPSGNRVEVSLEPAGEDGIRKLRCEWLRWPPSRRDREHYQEVVAPAILGRVCEYLEIPLSKALLLALER